MKKGESVNEFGTLVSVHECEFCGEEFTCCPARSDSNDNWRGCLAIECPSYDLSRDIDLAWDSDLLGGHVMADNHPAPPVGTQE